MAQLNNLLVTGNSRFINLINGACSNCYATCSTASSTVAKVATVQNTNSFILTTGATVHVKFTNGNEATNPTLNVNSTGAYPIIRMGTTAPGTKHSGSWGNNSLMSFTFDGTNWLQNDYSTRYVMVNGTSIGWNDLNLKSGTNLTVTNSDGDVTFNTTSTDSYSSTGTVPITGKGVANAISNTTAANSATGISIADHTTTTIYGVKSSTTTASKVTLGTSFTVPNVTSAGSASTWVFEDITVPKAASSATSIPNVTAAGEGDFTATVTNGVLSFSHTHTPPTLGDTISVTGVSGSTTASHVKSGGNGTAPNLGNAFTIPNVTGNSDVTVPIKNDSNTTVVTTKTHSITDNGHTHTLS